jgi:hypothetical protein
MAQKSGTRIVPQEKKLDDAGISPTHMVISIGFEWF